jgi:hypothetical protein
LVLASCGAPTPGSEEDLAAQIDVIEMPHTITQLSGNYDSDCAQGERTCPGLVRWYAATEPIEVAKLDVLGRFETAGISVHEVSGSQIATARNEDYLYFLVFDAAMIDANPNAPAGTDFEISVTRNPESEAL